MIPNEVIFRVENRRKTFVKNGNEWALFVRFVDCSSWCLHTWKNKPTEKEVDCIKKIILRSFEFYHRHLHIPLFNLKVSK